MVVLHASAFLRSPDAAFDHASEDRVPVVVTRENGPAVVILSLEDHNSIEEMAYLLRSPNNASRLRASLEQARQGLTVERPILE